MTPRSVPRAAPPAQRGRPSGRDRGSANRAGTRGPGGCRRGRRPLRRPATAARRTGRGPGCGGEVAAVVARPDERRRGRPALRREEREQGLERLPVPMRWRGQRAPGVAADAASPGVVWAGRVAAAGRPGTLRALRDASASELTTRAQRDRAPAGVGAERSGTGSRRVRLVARRRHERRERHPAERVLLPRRPEPPEPTVGPSWPERPGPTVRQGGRERPEPTAPLRLGAGTRGVHRGRQRHAHAARDGPGDSGAPRARRARGSGGRP